mgnify:CR=1 FL=1
MHYQNIYKVFVWALSFEFSSLVFAENLKALKPSTIFNY